MPSKKAILLIQPPVAKPCEPPAGVARLAGALQAAGIDCRVYDASLEGLLEATGEGDRYCNACFTGEYPIAVHEAQAKLSFEGAIA